MQWQLTFSNDSLALEKYFLILALAAFLIASSLVVKFELRPSNHDWSSPLSSASMLASKWFTNSPNTQYIS